MSRRNAWEKHYPEIDTARLTRLWSAFAQLKLKLEQSWYYKYLPKDVHELVDLANHLRYEAGAHGQQSWLRYKVAVLTTELKTYKENAAKAREIKQKYNEFRRERWENAKISKSE